MNILKEWLCIWVGFWRGLTYFVLNFRLNIGSFRECSSWLIVWSNALSLEFCGSWHLHAQLHFQPKSNFLECQVAVSEGLTPQPRLLSLAPSSSNIPDRQTTSCSAQMRVTCKTHKLLLQHHLVKILHWGWQFGGKQSIFAAEVFWVI